MTIGIQVEAKVQFSNGRKGRKKLSSAPAPIPVEPGRLPRITRMLALAHRFDRLLREGTVADQADLARLGHVSRARVTQILNLLQLAPDIQETILFLPRIQSGRELINEHEVRPIATNPVWKEQRRRWGKLVAAKMSVR